MSTVYPYPVLTPNSDSEAFDLLRGYEHAKRKRDLMQNLFSECYDWALPSRQSWFGQGNIGEDRTSNIYDETAVVSTQEFASRIISGLFPAFRRWFDLKPGVAVPEGQHQEVSAKLEQIAKVVFEELNESNFHQEIHEAFLDLAVSTGVVLIEPGLRPDDRIQFSAIPLPHVVLDVGPRDEIDSLYRELERRVEHLKALWPKAVIPAEVIDRTSHDPNATVKLVECCKRDWDSRVEAYDYKVIELSTQKVIARGRYTGEGSCPFIAFRWSKASGEVYGRGPLINALPAIRTLNLVQQMLLENADLAIAGIWQAEDDGVLNPDTVSLVPGTIIPKGTGKGLQPLKAAGDFSLADFVLKDMRQNVKKALYNETLGPREGTPMSAAEVNQRTAELARQIGAAFGRLHHECVQPILRRVFYLLRQRGDIQLPAVGGQVVKIVSTSPLAKDQEMQDLLVVDRWLEMLMSRFGPQVVNLVTDNVKVSQYAADKLGVPPSLVRSAVERAQLTAMVQGMAPQGEAPPGPPDLMGVGA